MGETTLRILLYGLIAALSPLAFAATIAVLKSRRARLNGLIYAVAFLLGESVVVLLVIGVGAITAPGQDSRQTAAAVLELALGALLLAAAARVHRGVAARQSSDGRTRRLLARLEGLTAWLAFWAGFLLGVGGPKRLTLSIIAATTISAAGLSSPDQVVAGALYVVVGGLLVWVPVALYLVAGKRSAAWMARAESWLTANQRTVTVGSLAVFGVVLVVDGLVQLL